jgi:hypothetical protein
MMSERHRRRDRPLPFLLQTRVGAAVTINVCYILCSESARNAPTIIFRVQRCLVLDTELACRMD